MKRILVVGYSAWDIVFPLAHTPDADTKTEVAPIITCGGGPGATAAVALKRLGCDVTLLTVLSDDAEGRMHLEQLSAEGIDTSRVSVAPDTKTPRAIIRVDPRTAERRIYWGRGTLPRLQASAVDLSWLNGIDLLYCDTHEASAACVLAEAARNRGLPVVLDAGSIRDNVKTLIPWCTDVIGATGFARALTGTVEHESALVALKRLGPARVGSTFGPRGVLGLDETGFCRIPAYAVEAVDTTGAGDAFHAGYARARVDSLDFPSALRYGSAVAALSCRSYGGREGLPDENEVTTLLTEGRPVGDGPELS